MRRAAVWSAAAAGLLFLGLLWVSGLEVALQYPESYLLPDRTRNIGVLVGWAAVLCGFVAFGLQRQLLHSRWWPWLALAAFLASSAALGWLTYADARDYPRLTFGFVAGTGVSRLLVLAAVGLVAPAALAALAAALLRRSGGTRAR